MPVVERTRAKPREVRIPVYLAFAKVGGGWQKIGAGNFKSGENGYSLQITAIPLNWDRHLFWLCRWKVASRKSRVRTKQGGRRVRPFLFVHQVVFVAGALPFCRPGYDNLRREADVAVLKN
jgi:hypothetical protein